MEIQNQNLYADDDIDLREVIRILVRHKWAILIISLLVALIAFIINQYFIPRMYNSKVAIAINRRGFSGYEYPIISETNELVEGAYSVEVIDQLADLDSSVEYEVRLDAGDFIWLSVIAPDPNEAERLTNDWANAFIKDLENEFVFSPIQRFETALNFPRESLNEADKKLTLANSENNIRYLEIQFENSNTVLENLVARKQKNQAKIAAAQLLIDWFAEDDSGSTLSVHQNLNILGLYQFEVSGPIQPDLLPDGYTAGQARADLLSLVEILQESDLEYARQIESAEDDVTSNRIQLDQAKFEANRYTIERDSAHQTNIELQARIQPQLLSLKDIVEQKIAIAEIIARSEKPDTPVRPDVFTNTVLAGVVGMVAAMGVVIVFETWNLPEEERRE